MSHLSVVILAAGKGKRMKSPLPKVLHTLGGKPFIVRVVEAAVALEPNDIYVIHGTDKAAIAACFTDTPLHWVAQSEPKGTGDAVKRALPHLSNSDRVLTLLGDVPLIAKDTLQDFVRSIPVDTLGVMTVKRRDPTGLGRIVREANGQIARIVEEKDASDEERRIDEVNTGIFVVPASKLAVWLPQLEANNAQKEYYLTDIVPMAKQDGVPVVSYQVADETEVMGVNTPAEKALAERIFQRQQACYWLEQGVAIQDMNRFDVRGPLRIGHDVRIDVNVIFEGENEIADGVSIGSSCVIKDCQIGPNVTVQPFSHLDGVVIEAGASIGPYARLRPGTHIESAARVGNFVELKKARLGQSSKVNHLSYVGDATLGPNVNIGAGTIFCNYDGVNKHHTWVDEGAFVGSGCQLVAPVRVEKNATVGAGTTLTKDAAADSLTVARVKQRTVSGWERPVAAKES